MSDQQVEEKIGRLRMDEAPWCSNCHLLSGWMDAIGLDGIRVIIDSRDCPSPKDIHCVICVS